MNDTMYQEAMLHSIETIDDVVLESEYEVVRSLLDVYIKDAMIQEAAVVEEGYKPAERTAYTSGKKVEEDVPKKVEEDVPKKNLFKRALEFILGLIRKLRKKVADIIAAIKKKLSKSDSNDITLTISCDVNAIAAVLKEASEILGSGRLPKSLSGDFKKRIENAVKKQTEIPAKTFFEKSSEIDGFLATCEDAINKMRDLNDGDREMLPNDFAQKLGVISDTMKLVYDTMGTITDDVYKQLATHTSAA